MRRKAFSVFVFISAVSSMLGGGAARADFRRIAAVPIEGEPMVSFDISWVDHRGHFYCLADRSNAAVHFIDAGSNTYMGRATGFVGVHPEGNPRSGPNGVLVIESQHEAWASDGDSTVKVIDLLTREIVDTIDTSREPGDKRADEMAYDPRDHILMVANNEDSPPFLTFIDTQTHQVLGRLEVPEATDGLEQPVFDHRTGKFLQAVPETKENPGGEIKVIDPVTRQLENTYPIPVTQDGRHCSPHGLDLGPRHELLVGCSLAGTDVLTVIMNAGNGEIVKSFTEVGASDQVWFNQGDGNYYLAARNFPGGSVLGIIDSEKNEWVDNIPTAPNSHSVAASRRNNEVFVPFTPLAGDPECSNGCVAIFADEDN